MEAQAKMSPLQREAFLNLDLFEEAVRDAIREAAGVADEGGGGATATGGGVLASESATTPNPRLVTRGSGFRKGRGVNQRGGA